MPVKRLTQRCMGPDYDVIDEGGAYSPIDVLAVPIQLQVRLIIIGQPLYDEQNIICVQLYTKSCCSCSTNAYDLRNRQPLRADALGKQTNMIYDGNSNLTSFWLRQTENVRINYSYKTVSGYNAFVVSRGKPNMYLSCHFGKSVIETSAGKGKGTGKVYKSP